MGKSELKGEKTFPYAFNDKCENPLIENLLRYFAHSQNVQALSENECLHFE